MAQTIAVLAAGYLALVVLMYATQRSLVFQPSGGAPGAPAAWGVSEMAEVELVTDDGLGLLAWFAEAAPGRPTIAYFHGNAGHIGYRADKVRPYLDAGYGVLLVSYRGYGGNPGRPSEDGVYRDARAALAFLAGRGIGAGATVLYGESLGSGVAVQMAWERARDGAPAAALVLETPLSTLPDVGQHLYPYLPVRWLAKDRFDSVAKIGSVATPVFVFHGDADRVVPQRFGRKLFEATAEPKDAAWFPGGSHDDLYDHGAAEAVLAFLARLAETRG